MGSRFRNSGLECEILPQTRSEVAESSKSQLLVESKRLGVAVLILYLNRSAGSAREWALQCQVMALWPRHAVSKKKKEAILIFCAIKVLLFSNIGTYGCIIFEG